MKRRIAYQLSDDCMEGRGWRPGEILNALYSMPMPIQQHGAWSLADSSHGLKCADVALAAVRDDAPFLTLEDAEYAWLKPQMDRVLPKMWGINGDPLCALVKEEKLPVIQKLLGIAMEEPSPASAVATEDEEDAGVQP